MEYYDLVLGSIPVSLIGGTGALVSLGIAWSSAISIASLIAIGVIAHALFINVPVPGERARVEERPHAASSGTTFQSAD